MGATGPISEYDFRQLIKYDEVGDFVVKNPERRWYWANPENLVIHRHFFLNGVEVGYWSPMTGLGYVFETPRVWCKEFKDALLPQA